MDIEIAIQSQVDIIKRDLDLVTVRHQEDQLTEVRRLKSLMDYLDTMIVERNNGKTQW